VRDAIAKPSCRSSSRNWNSGHSILNGGKGLFSGGAQLSQFEQIGSTQPTSTRPTELRYRLADWINDRIRALPFAHRTLKNLFSRPDSINRSVSEQQRLVANTVQPSIPSTADAQVSSPPSHVKASPISLDAIPYPPLEMRELIGTTDTNAFDNPQGKLAFGYLDFGRDPAIYERVFDFGCGCGRIARQLLLQRPQPKRYVGVDLHAGMIRWCKANLEPAASDFTFIHHDVFNVSFNRNAANRWTTSFPVGAAEFSLVLAHSVFTHLTEEQAAYYFRECSRILDAGGLLYSSWFLFDKQDYPMMYDHNNALYVSYEDPAGAVLFDKNWVRSMAHEVGLRICGLIPPSVRGHQWVVIMTHRQDLPEPEFPTDDAPRGWVRASFVKDRDPEKIGLEPESRETGEP
jgi:SAM-dependent methyltransferase